VRFAAPEFTSLCPVTGQPDFAHLVIDYAPGETIVESKALAVFGSFRNHNGFHEDVTVGIGQRLFERCAPAGCASAATGIRAAASRSTCSGRPARRQGLWLPDQGVPAYRAGNAGQGQDPLRRSPAPACP
jgi:7-cyano-7-deazaguanine reductase